MNLIQGNNQLTSERLHGPQDATTGTMPVKQVNALAARGMHPQGSVIRHSANHVGDDIVSHGDEIDIGIRQQTIQVISGIRAADSISKPLGVS